MSEAEVRAKGAMTRNRITAKAALSLEGARVRGAARRRWGSGLCRKAG